MGKIMASVALLLALATHAAPLRGAGAQLLVPPRSRIQGSLVAVADRSLSSQLDHIALNAEAQGFNGSVYIALNGQPLLDKAYGWTGPDRIRRVDTDTLFNIASVSKAITATAILKLVESGKLDIHQRIGTIFSDVPADKQHITVEELLVHTSCLPNRYAANGISSRDEAVKAILATPLLCQPGTKFKYTDDGYTLLAAIIELVGGRRYSDFVRDNIFRPARMRESRFWEEVDDRTSPNVARIVTLAMNDQFRGVNWGYIGPGGIWSNADELAKYFDALMTGKIVTKESVSEMLAPQVKVSVGSAGFGWFIGHSTINTSLIFARGNEDWGHSALVFWYPDRRILLTIVTNSGFDHGTPVSRILAGRFEAVLLSSPSPPGRKRLGLQILSRKSDQNTHSRLARPSICGTTRAYSARLRCSNSSNLLSTSSLERSRCAERTSSAAPTPCASASRASDSSGA